MSTEETTSIEETTDESVETTPVDETTDKEVEDTEEETEEDAEEPTEPEKTPEQIKDEESYKKIDTLTDEFIKSFDGTYLELTVVPAILNQKITNLRNLTDEMTQCREIEELMYKTDVKELVKQIEDKGKSLAVETPV